MVISALFRDLSSFWKGSSCKGCKRFCLERIWAISAAAAVATDLSENEKYGINNNYSFIENKILNERDFILTICKIPKQLWDVLLLQEVFGSLGNVRVFRLLSGSSGTSHSPTYIPAYCWPNLSFTHSGMLLTFSGILKNYEKNLMKSAILYSCLYYKCQSLIWRATSYLETRISTLFFPAKILSASLRMNGRWPVWSISILRVSLLSSLNGWTWFCSRSPFIL